MPRMTPEEIDAFLTSVGVCKLACLEPDGSPYIVPVSYFYRDGGFYLGGRGRAAWGAYLQRDGRVGLSIEEGKQRVQVKGHAELLNEPVLGMGKLEGMVREKAERTGDMDYFTTL
jgi:nitroimidazol reductase NimA-like FMN-containing flavoprotein (pyridoxamine 5'-phosphate oxidase superfamily)